jgi:hypothetical protein
MSVLPNNIPWKNSAQNWEITGFSWRNSWTGETYLAKVF